MVPEAALIAVCCVLFTQMGLSGAIQELLHIKLSFLSCPKCLTFWSCLGWFAFHDCGVLQSVAASFIASYCALWLCLVYDSLALLYNYLYEQITETPGTSEDACAGNESPAPDGSNEVPTLQQ